MAQLVEHILGKDEVPSSNLGSSSKKGITFLVNVMPFLILSINERTGLRTFCANPVRIPDAKSVKLACKLCGAVSSRKRIPG